MEPTGENKAKGMLSAGERGALLYISRFPRNFVYVHYGESADEA